MEEKPKDLIDIKNLILELFGTLSLTYISSWAFIFVDLNHMGKNGLGLTCGLTLLAFSLFSWKKSGAHFNPAITIALTVLKKIEITTAIFYIISQFLGALIGAGFVFIQMNDKIETLIASKSIMGIPTPFGNYEGSEFIIEMLGTFFITYVYMSCYTDNNPNKVKEVGPIAVSCIYYLAIISLCEISGGGFNPARSLAPAIVNGIFKNLQFIHFVAPIVGSILAAIIYNSVFIDDNIDLKEEKRIKRAENQAMLNPE